MRAPFDFQSQLTEEEATDGRDRCRFSAIGNSVRADEKKGVYTAPACSVCSRHAFSELYVDR